MVWKNQLLVIFTIFSVFFYGLTKSVSILYFIYNKFIILLYTFFSNLIQRVYELMDFI